MKITGPENMQSYSGYQQIINNVISNNHSITFIDHQTALCELLKQARGHLSLAAGSTSVDSSHLRLKIFHGGGGEDPEIPKSKTWICHAPKNYLHSIYIVLGIVNNLEMI